MLPSKYIFKYQKYPRSLSTQKVSLNDLDFFFFSILSSVSTIHCHFFFLPVFVSQFIIFTLALITTKLWFAGIVNMLCVLYNDTLPPFSYINCTNLYRHCSYKNLLTRFQLCLRDHNHHHLAIFLLLFSLLVSHSSRAM